MPVRGGVVVTTTQPALPPGVTPDLPATAKTLPVFTVGGSQPHISDSLFKQTAAGGILIGAGAAGTGSNAVCIGAGANGQGGAQRCVAIGSPASAGTENIAIGYGADAITGTRQIAIGRQAKSSQVGAGDNISIGYAAGWNNTQSGWGNIAIGSNAQAQGGLTGDAIGIGRGCDAAGIATIALGVSAWARHPSAVSIGNRAASTQAGEVTFGTTIFGGLQVTLFSVRPAAGTPVRHRNSADGWCIRNLLNTADIFKVDESAVAGDARLLLWDVDTGLLKRVTFGAGSGVAGDVLNKYLRVVV